MNDKKPEQPRELEETELDQIAGGATDGAILVKCEQCGIVTAHTVVSTNKIRCTVCGNEKGHLGASLITHF